VTALVGAIALMVAFAAALGSLATLSLALVQRREDRHARVFPWLTVMVVGVVVAAVAMEVAILGDDFSLAYVAGNSTRDTPLIYKVATLWGSLEGSLLLWALVLCSYIGAVTVAFRRRIDDRVVAWALLTMVVVALFFLYLLIRPADPFRTLDNPPADGNGLNPLLRNHPLMAVHPVALYLGYVGFTVPFGFAVGALVTGRLGEGWLVATRRWTMIAWGCLTVGIVLGAWWSYEVLGWGGYWAWDPVENASFLPWLTGTAFIHSVIVQERRGMLRVWNLSLLLSTFALTIFGTFLTRSGVIDSVHEFASSELGPTLLAFVTLIVVVSVGLIGWRGDRLRSPGSIDSPVSREGAFLANNFLFAAFAFIVLLGTLFPLMVEAVNGDQIAVGRPYFDRMLMPIGIALLFLMGIAPLLTWRSTSAEVVLSRALGPAAAGAGAMVVAVVRGADGVLALAGFGLGGLVIGSGVRHLALALRRQGWRGLTGRAGGGMVAHLGVALLAVGLIASTAYGEQGEFVLAPGETGSVAGWTVRFVGFEEEMDGSNLVVRALVDIEGRGVFAPRLTRYPTFGRPIATPSVSSGLDGDVYLVMSVLPEDGDDEVAIRVLVKPLVAWMWIGGLVMGLGTLLALVPPGRRREDVVADPEGDEGHDQRAATAGTSDR